jgi:hypothetical protein
VTRAARLACAAFAALLFTTFALPTTTGAADDAEVSTDPTGAHVKLVRRGAWVEVRAPGAAGGSSGGVATGCQRRWVPTKYPNYLYPGFVKPDINLVAMPDAPGPEYVAYHVYCGGVYVTSVWLAPDAFSPTAGAIDVRAIAEQLVRDLPYPAATVRVSPEGRGLTGLESWFWVEGYAGPLRDAVDELGFRVEVEAVPAQVTWDFGDDTPSRPGSLGQAAPTRSDVFHTYERSSRDGLIRIRASIRLDVRFRVNDEPWEALDPVFRTGTRDYPVVESRAALVAPR